MKGWELALLALIALVPRLVNLDHAPVFDELYHVLAARSWAADGTLAIAEGVYERASLFTKLLGVLFRFFDDTLVVARIPSVAAGVASVIVVASWTSGRAGRAAGWIAGLLLASDPGAIHLSQFARFYSVHALLFFVAAAALFSLIEQRSARSVAWKRSIGVLIVAALLTALHLQKTTIIGLLALGVWVLGAVSVRWWAGRGRHRRLRWAPVALLALGLLVGAVMARSGVLDELWRLYRSGPLWSAPQFGRFRFYELWFVERYPVLWALLPVALLVAASRFRRATLFAATLFGVSFVLSSFAGAKSERYLYFAVPFFFVLWGLAAAVGIPAFHQVLGAVWSGVRLPGRLRQSSNWAILVAVGLFVAYYNPATRISRHLLFPGDEVRPYSQPEWGKAAPALRRLADSADVVLSSALPKAIYYLGRGDISLSRTELVERPGKAGVPAEFSVDHRTGRPTISSPESMDRVVKCFARGLLIIEDAQLRAVFIVPDSTVAYLMRNTSEALLDASWGIRAFQWNRDSAHAGPTCPSVRGRAPAADS